MDYKLLIKLVIIATLISAINTSFADGNLLQPHIINGEPTIRGEFSVYVLVLIEVQNDDRVGRCGGTLIAANKVLTAAHCLPEFVQSEEGETFDVSGFTVVPEYYSEDDFENLDRRIRVESVSIHPDYRKTVLNDIAILTLEERVTIKPASVFFGEQSLSQKNVSVIGNGLISEYPLTLPSVLQKFETLIGSNQECNDFLDSDVFESSSICLKPQSSKAKVCFGDSGSPLLLADRNTVVVGVSSFIVASGDFGDCSGNDNLAGYTRVSSFTGFIKEQSPETRFSKLGSDIIPAITDLLLR